MKAVMLHLDLTYSMTEKVATPKTAPQSGTVPPLEASSAVITRKAASLV